MAEKVKITKDIVPDNFTLGLVFVDAVPVILFGISMIIASQKMGSILFLIAAVLCTLSGLGKVIWKLIVVLKKKNVWWLFVQMRIAMPIGMLIMLIIFIVFAITTKLFGKILCMPISSAICFILSFLGMVLMGVFAAKLDSSNLKSNWIEQTTNSIAQALFLVGILLL